VVRERRVTSAHIGARNGEQFANSSKAVKKVQFMYAELSEIDYYAEERAIDLRKGARERSA
jgi:L-glyceraldehyde 3-phosphate reductase